MQVVYRITDIPSSNPSPYSQDDKVRLNKFCLDSFIEAYSDVKPKVIFLADYVRVTSYLEDFPWEHEIIKTENGQNQAMINSYDIATGIDDFVIFHEADYLYNGVIGKTYLEAMSELGIVSPYDHPNFYSAREFHKEECRMTVVANHHFRTTERNTMTWGCHSNIIKENLSMLKSHGYLDGPVWYQLLERGYALWTPIPSFATHMVKDCLSHGIDWKEKWQNTRSS